MKCTGYNTNYWCPSDLLHNGTIVVCIVANTLRKVTLAKS